MGRRAREQSVIGRVFELVEDGVEPRLVGKGEGLKFDANAVAAGPADRGPLDQERDFLSGGIQEEIHFHAGEDRSVAFETAACARDIHGSRDGMRPVLIDQCP